MKRKVFIVGSIALMGAIASAATYNIVLDSKQVEYKIDTWSEISPIVSEWVYGNEYDCSGWIPSVNDYNEGISFDQDNNCKVDKTRTTQRREQSNVTGEIKNIGEPTIETVTENTTDTQQNIGTYRGTKCLDVLNKGDHHGSGMYTLQNGNSVYCEMTVAGGGFQLKRTREYISDGNMTDGSGINTEDGSNPVNEIISFANPVSNTVVRQPYSTSMGGANKYYTEYEIHPEVCDMVAGDYIALTLWQDQPMSTYWAFHNRYWDKNGGAHADGGTAGLIDQKVVNGRTWYQYRYIKPIPEDARNIVPITDYDSQSCHSWYVGYTASPSMDVHVTGFSLQVYTK